MANDSTPMGDPTSHTNLGLGSVRKPILRLVEPLEGRPVLSTGLGSWRWQRATEVAVVVCLAIIGSTALPLAIQGAAWVLPRMLRLLLR